MTLNMKKIKHINTLLLLIILFICGMEGFQKTDSIDSTNKIQSGIDYPIMNLIQYVNPFCGTGKDGNTYPGASLPFGMIQWSPDAGPSIVRGGYNYKDSTIYGFSLDHLSGAGCYYAENFSFMPVIGKLMDSPPESRTAFSTPFSHSNETAVPGCYSVKLDNGIKVELTVTLRTGFGRFTFPDIDSAAIVVNTASNVRGAILSNVHINPSANSISGSVAGGHFCGETDVSTIYFYAVFNRPFLSHSAWSGDSLIVGGNLGVGQESGVYLTFDLSKNKIILVKTAMSYVSIANAKSNLEKENPVSSFTSNDFDDAAGNVAKIWNSKLNKIQISGGRKEDLKTFYSMMYHTMLGPTVCSDVNGEYMGYDEKVHKTKNGRVQYANFSGWDIYRSECQFLAMIAPDEASDMAQSLLIDYRQGGAFPRWGVPNMDSGVMMGDPAAPIIADFYAFEARNFDTKDALVGLVRAATDPSVRAPRSHTKERDALEDYLKLGYVPEFQRGGYGNVSMTLEYTSADFALSQFAKALDDETDYKLLLDHAQNWINLFNPEIGFLQMRRRNDSWAPGVADSLQVYDGDRAYVEGTAEQYVWMVPFNLKELAEKMGGMDSASKRLDKFFTELNAGFRSKYAYMGNEPCLETPWIYCFLNKPYKTQEIVRKIINELYSSDPIGYPGNDDLGEMSSWYIFSALGMYPEIPGSDVLVLGSPLFPKTVLHLSRGDITIEGINAGRDIPYVQSLKINGEKWNKPWIRFSDISKGGVLIYELGRTPDKNWGSNSENVPPSYSNGK